MKVMKVTKVGIEHRMKPGANDFSDLAEYTEANERLHLGKGANKAAARRLKGEIGEMIDDL